MIRIIHGKEAQLRTYFAGLHSKNFALWLPEQAGGFYGFGALRHLLSQLGSFLGRERIGEAFERDRAAASFVEHRLIDQLTPTELQRRHYYAARITSNLSHNWYLQRPLIETWAKTLSDLLSEKKFTILIPVLNHLDVPSIGVIKALYRLYPEHAPALILGYESKANEPELDANGIDWSDNQLYLQKLAQGLVELSAAPVLALDKNVPEPGIDDALRESERNVPDSLYSSLEARAMKMLEASTGAADRDLVEAVLRATGAAFGCSDFHTAIRLGLILLERKPHLEPCELADLHGTIALSTHNIDLGRMSAGPEIKQFLANHYEAALANETRPEVRCALYYRLSVTYGRRKKNLQRGMYWADKAIMEAQALDLPPEQKLYYECWGRNMKSYILMLQGKIEDGFGEGELVFRRLARALERYSDSTSEDEEPAHELWRREIFMTQVVICENMSTLGYRTRSAEQYLDWLRTQDELISQDLFNFDDLNAYNWVHFYSEQFQPSLALPWVVKGIESLRKSFRADLEQELVLIATSIEYRLGNAADASEYVDRFLAGFPHLKSELAESAQELDFVNIFMRSGELDRAEEVLRRALHGAEGQTPAGRGELLVNLGLVSASRGDGETAERLINQAIDFAVQSGERDTLLRVAATTAYTCLLLQRVEDARDAYMKALGLAETDTASPPPDEDLLEIYLGLYECRDPGESWGLRALDLLPGVLESDDSWWRLSRLLVAVNDAAQRDPELLDSPRRQAALDALLGAGSQRADCRDSYAELMQSLSASSSLAASIR